MTPDPRISVRRVLNRHHPLRPEFLLRHMKAMQRQLERSALYPPGLPGRRLNLDPATLRWSVEVQPVGPVLICSAAAEKILDFLPDPPDPRPTPPVAAHLNPDESRSF